MALTLYDLLKLMGERGASDLHITTGTPPRMRIGGKVAYPKDAAIDWLKQRCDFF